MKEFLVKQNELVEEYFEIVVKPLLIARLNKKGLRIMRNKYRIKFKRGNAPFLSSIINLINYYIESNYVH